MHHGSVLFPVHVFLHSWRHTRLHLFSVSRLCPFYSYIQMICHFSIFSRARHACIGACSINLPHYYLLLCLLVCFMHILCFFVRHVGKISRPTFLLLPTGASQDVNRSRRTHSLKFYTKCTPSTRNDTHSPQMWTNLVCGAAEIVFISLCTWWLYKSMLCIMTLTAFRSFRLVCGAPSSRPSAFECTEEEFYNREQIYKYSYVQMDMTPTVNWISVAVMQTSTRQFQQALVWRLLGCLEANLSAAASQLTWLSKKWRKRRAKRECAHFLCVWICFFFSLRYE